MMDDEELLRFACERLNKIETQVAVLYEWKGSMDKMHADLIVLVSDMNTKLDDIKQEQHMRMGGDRTRYRVTNWALAGITALVGALGAVVYLI